MNNKTDIDVKYVSPLKKICMTIGELPSSYLETMSYYEMLVWFTEFLKKQVIPTVNNNAEAVQELQTLYEELRTYVNNYFDNLDVQDEINNKLAAMAESGQLTDIIAQYLGLAGMIAFDTVADMKLAQNLVNGSKCRTLGYHSVNDGGGAYYKIRQVTNDDVIDEMFIIEVYDNLLVAELVLDEVFIPEQLGAKNDGSTDASDVFAAIFSKMDDNNKLLMTGTYLIDDALYLPNKNNIVISGGTLKAGENLTGYILNSNSTAVTGYAGWNFKTENLTIENVFIDGSYTANGIYLDNYLRAKIISCTIHNILQYGIYLNNGHEAQIIGTNIIGKTNGDEDVASTGILINCHDNIIDSCVIAYCQWAIDILQSTNQICNSHFYCNRENGGNIKLTKTSSIYLDNNYFDGSGIYAINPWHLNIANNIFHISSATNHILKFTKDGSNISIADVWISNSMITDDRGSTTSIDFIECDFQPHEIRNCVIDKINSSTYININNPYNIFSFNNSMVPIIIPDSYFRATYNQSTHTVGEQLSIENMYEVSSNGNYIDSNYIGSQSSYPWLFAKIYVPEQMLITKDVISNTSLDLAFFDSSLNFIANNKITATKGNYYIGIYRTHTILLSNK